MNDEIFFVCALPENLGHPAVPMLLYAYCPRAAWLHRLEGLPQPQPGPERRALLDAAFYGYRALRRALADLGFGPAWPAVRRYIEAAEAHRRQLRRRGVLAPGREETPEFLETFALELPVGPHGVDRVSLRRLGGPDGLRRYVRAWVFLARDWAGLDGPPPPDFTVSAETLYLRVPGTGQAPLAVPAFRVGGRLGILAGALDPVLAGLLPPALDAWLFMPSGEARPVPQPGTFVPGAAAFGGALAEAARSGPFPPLRGLAGGCQGCPYLARCFRGGQLLADEEVVSPVKVRS